MAAGISLNKISHRFLIFSSSGIISKFFLDVVFSLIYRNYELIQNISSYFYGVILTILVLEGIYWINKGFAKKYSWDNFLIKRLALQFLADSFYAILLVVFVRLVVSFLFFDKDFIRFSDEAIYLVFSVFLMAIITLGDLGGFLFIRWRTSLVEIEKYKKEKAEFHLGMLQAQINPHFLFNSLNTLSSLIFESKELAAEYTRELADVYRYVLESRKNELVTLEEERIFTNSLIKLYKIRFNKKLVFNVDINRTNGFSIPPLILQLLLENAVKHNIISQTKPLTIDVIQNNDKIMVKNKLQLKRSISYSSEVGLDNIVNRYKYFTDNEVVIKKTDLEFIVEIPLIKL